MGFRRRQQKPKNPMGGVSGQIHSWMFNQKAFWEYLGFDGGKEDGADGKYIRETIARTGAFIMGKRMFEEGEASWPNDLYKADVFVLTHEIRETLDSGRHDYFYFINDGIEHALALLARQSAKRQRYTDTRGTNTIQQFLNAGLIDEFFIHIAPVFWEAELDFLTALIKTSMKFKSLKYYRLPLLLISDTTSKRK